MDRTVRSPRHPMGDSGSLRGVLMVRDIIWLQQRPMLLLDKGKASCSLSVYGIVVTSLAILVWGQLGVTPLASSRVVHEQPIFA